MPLCRWPQILPLTLLLTVLAACADSEGPKTAGFEGAPCYGNGTCDLGLACQAQVCVKPAEGSKGGACYGNKTCDAGLLCTADTCTVDPNGPIFVGEDVAGGETTESPDATPLAGEDTAGGDTAGKDTAGEDTGPSDETEQDDASDLPGIAVCDGVASGSFSELEDGEGVESSGIVVTGSGSDSDGVTEVLLVVDELAGCTIAQNYSGSEDTVNFSIPLNLSACGILDGTHAIAIWVQDACSDSPVMVATVSVKILTPCGSCPGCTACEKGTGACVPDSKQVGETCGAECHRCDAAGECAAEPNGTVCGSEQTCNGGTCVAKAGCGNGVKDGTDECDKSDIGQATCVTAGYSAGTIDCGSDCLLDTGGCCDDECSSGETKCTGGAQADCTKPGDCWKWSSPSACANGCEGSTCAPPPDDCGAITWSEKAPLEEPDQTIISAAIDGKIHVLGWSFYKRHRVYDPVGNTWTKLNDLPGDCAEGALVSAGGTLFAFGTGTFDANFAYRWNSANDSWTAKAENPFPRRLPASGVIGDQVVLAGGFAGFDQTVNTYDFVNDEWADGTSLTADSGGMAHAVVDGRLYVFGGDDAPYQTKAYDPLTKVWDDLPSLPAGRYLAQAVVIDGRIWVLGGRESNKPKDTILVFDPASETWCDGPALPMPMYGFAASQIGEVIYIVGGHVPGGFDTVPGARVWEGVAE